MSLPPPALKSEEHRARELRNVTYELSHESAHEDAHGSVHEDVHRNGHKSWRFLCKMHHGVPTKPPIRVITANFTVLTKMYTKVGLVSYHMFCFHMFCFLPPPPKKNKGLRGSAE